ncbi:MAG: SH3 domain-containing protein, partial [Planctomycetota bacterium]
QSARTCRGPTVEEIKKGDYARFPYHRAGRWCTADSKRVAPVLWEKEADRNGKVVVAFNTGAVKYMERKEIERLIAELEK